MLEFQFIKLSYIASTIGAKGWVEANVIPHGDDEWAKLMGVQVLFLRDGRGSIEGCINFIFERWTWID